MNQTVESLLIHKGLSKDHIVSSECNASVASTFERRYFKIGPHYVKRSLRPNEYQHGYHGVYVPRLGQERLKNEANCLRLIRKHTKIPVPRVHMAFEHQDAFYLDHASDESNLPERHDHGAKTKHETDKTLDAAETSVKRNFDRGRKGVAHVVKRRKIKPGFEYVAGSEESDGKDEETN